MHRYLKVSEVVTQLHVDANLLNVLATQEVIHLKPSSEGDLVISAEDVERVRTAMVLMDELDVNLAGVEVIMHMRDSMLALQHQVSEILDALVEEMRHKLPR